MPGTRLTIDGRNADSSWIRVKVPDSTASYYISATLLKVSGNIEAAPVLADPPTPTPNPFGTATSAPQITDTP